MTKRKVQNAGGAVPASPSQPPSIKSLTTPATTAAPVAKAPAARAIASQPSQPMYQRAPEPRTIEQVAPIPVQLYEQTPNPNYDPFTAYYLLVRSASDFLRFENFDLFMKTALGCESQLPPYEKIVFASKMFVALNAAVMRQSFCNDSTERKELDLKTATPAGQSAAEPTPPVPKIDREMANRIFRPYTLDFEQLAKFARNLLQNPMCSPNPAELLADARTIIQQVVKLNPTVRQLGNCELQSGEFDGFMQSKLDLPPMMELLWNYWQEEGGLVQGINAITLRFQNRLYPGGDPLTRCNISYLRPLTNIIWHHVQHEPERLSLARRAYEYDHQYGLRLRGNAVPNMMPADSRTPFIEAFHRVLQEACRYYQTSMNTTMHADAFPMLNCLRELHLVLAEGSDNQYGDLPATARSEMIVQQWMLSRPEISTFLGGRPGVPYPEAWMPHMETLRQMMGWNDASIRHYHTLATCGEMLLLSIRNLNWSEVKDSTRAVNWLVGWRPEVQSYVHSYRSVTGVDLGVFDTPIVAGNEWAVQPSDLIGRRRLAAQKRIAP
jgi:hypothetical protein